MATMTLEPAAQSNTGLQSGKTDGLSNAVLYGDVRWFIGIRWGVVAVFAAFGVVAAVFPDLLAMAGLRPPKVWPWVLAGVVTLVNLVNIFRLRRLSSAASTKRSRIKANIWFQIVSDLLVLTVLIYLLGTVDTVIPFAYLFHISLACIFFGRRESFLVLLLSIVLFLSVVFLDAAGLYEHAGFLLPELRRAPGVLPTAIFALPTVFVWAIVWLLASSLSDDVRRRDAALERANRRIRLADEEINRQMLRVTHDLKAPFSGIESNIQLLKMLHWNAVNADVQKIIDKIDVRSASLRMRIGDILLLGSLRSAAQEDAFGTAPVKLHEVLLKVKSDLQALADSKHVTMVIEDGDAVMISDIRQLRILFLNLLSNAVTYSRENGVVTVSAIRDDNRTGIRIADGGIGISDEAMPHIFEDFYRTPEAVGVNPNSTGLGLAIIRQIAQNLDLTVTVESAPGRGTVFEVYCKDGALHGNVADKQAQL